MTSSPSRPLASSEERDGERKRTRRLQKKRPEMPSSTPELPEPLQDSDDSADEQFPDHLATPMSVNMNQSIFGLIAAAGSRVDFNTRFDGNSSDEEDSKDTQPETQGLAQTAVLASSSKDSSKDERRGHKKSRSKHRLLRSIATLPKLKSKAKRQSSRLSQPNLEVGPETDEPSDSSELSSQPTVALPRSSKRRPSVLSRMLEARAEMSSRPSFDIERKSSDLPPSDDSSEATLLAKRLMEIFEFDEPEQVVEGIVSVGMRC